MIALNIIKSLSTGGVVSPYRTNASGANRRLMCGGKSGRTGRTMLCLQKRKRKGRAVNKRRRTIESRNVKCCYSMKKVTVFYTH